MRYKKPTTLKTIRSLAGTLILALILFQGCDDENSTDSGSAPGFQSGDLAEGDTFTHTFEEEGTVDYFCENHQPDMTGEIVVSSDIESTENDTVEMLNTQFQPSSLTVAPNTEIVWINLDAAAHTVTQGQPSSDDDNGGGGGYDY